MTTFSNDLGFNPFDKTNDGASEVMGGKFLASFNQQHIFCYNGSPRKKISSMKHTQNMQEVYEANKNAGSDAYFYINGGRKQYAIDKIAACFCDMDAGRDEEGKYFKPSIVMKHKERFLQKINEFPVPPSWVVDTRNGYQCYWILNPNDRQVNKTTWKGVQKKLANHFGGDPLAIKINQIFRIPYTWWRKGWEGKAPYFTSILKGSTGNTVAFNDLKNILEGTSANIDYRKINKSSNAWFDAWKVVSDEAAANGTPIEKMSYQDQRQLHRKVADIVFEASHSQKAPVINNQNQEYTPDYRNPNDIGSIADHAKAVLKTVSQDSVDDLVNRYEDYRATGEPQPVTTLSGSDVPVYDPHKVLPSIDLNADTQQTFLLKKTVEFLNQVSTPLWFSKNHFLSRAARELADEISDKFCVG
jgi:hypothetical protein